MKRQSSSTLFAILFLILSLPFSSFAQEFLWGMTKTGGANNLGVAYRISSNGSDFALYSSFNGTNGASPGDGAGFTQYINGTSMIGVTEMGGCGSSCSGRAIGADLDGSTLGIYPDVQFSNSLGFRPVGKVTLGLSNNFITMNSAGGDQGYGSIVAFKFALVGNPRVPGYITEKLASFNGVNGKSPKGSLVLGPKAKLYGMAEAGGINDKGTVFVLDRGAIIKLFDFDGTTSGSNPAGSLVVGNDDKLYGMTKMGGLYNRGTIFRINSDGTGFTKLYDFDGTTSGGNAKGSLVQFTDGKFYGMTSAGGTSDFGTIFSISTDGTFNKIIDFDGVNGRSPVGDLTVSPNGMVMYGTAYSGGVNDKGTLFKLTNGQIFQKLYDFTSEGSNPVGSLMVKRQTQTVSIEPIPIKYKTAPPFTLVTKTSSGLPESIIVGNSNITLTGRTISINLDNVNTDIYPANTSIVAYQPGNYQFLPAYQPTFGFEAPPASVQVTLIRAPQTVSVQPIPDKVFGDAPFIPQASSSVGLPVTVRSSGSNVSINNGTVTMNGAGLVSLIFSQNGNNLYESAPDVTVTFGVQKAEQTITFNPPTPKICCDYFSLSATAKTSLTYTSESPDVGNMISENLVSPKRAGTILATAHAAENSNYRSAKMTKEVVIQKLRPFLSVSRTNVSVKFKDQSIYLVSSSYPSVPIVAKSSTPGIAEVDQYGYLNFIGIGTTSITVTQEATEATEAATPQVVNVTVNPPSVEGIGNVITWNSQGTNFYVGQASTNLIATASSGLPVRFSSSNNNVIEINGNQLLYKGAGTAIITASQPGEGTIVAASSTTRTYTISKKYQTIALPYIFYSVTVNNLPLVMPAKTNEGLPLTYYSSNSSIAEIINYHLVIYREGSVTITANQSGDLTYYPASTSASYDIYLTDPSIYFERLQPKIYGDPSFNLKANAAVEIPVSFTSSNTSVISISGNTATVLAAGTAKITASTTTQQGYRAGTSEQTIVVTKKSQSIIFNALPDKKFEDPDFVASATATSGLPVVFKTTTPAIVKISNNLVQIVGSGTATLIAMQPGNGNYLKADSVVRSFQISDSENTFSLVMSSAGGAPNGGGSLFSIDSEGNNRQLIKGFETPSNATLTGSFVRDANGKLYMNTAQGGITNTGTLIRIDEDGSNFTTLADYNLGVTGGNPFSSPIIGNDGYLYSTLTVSNGAGGGAIIRVKPDGTEMTKIFSFSSSSAYKPSASLLQASNGRLYGMTDLGGLYEAGVIYSINTDGTEFTILRNLSSTDITSYVAYSRVLLEGSDGLIYGSTFRGGSFDLGTIFKMNKDGSGYQAIVNFDNNTKGRMPGEIMIASDGKIYGMAIGVNNLNYIYSVKTDGTQYTKLTEFPSSSTAIYMSPLTEGTDGLLYGVLGVGGVNAAGIIFKISKDGSGLQTLHNFDVAINALGARGSLFEVSPGVFLGASRSGGANSLGNIFKITSSGDYTVLKSFTSTESMTSGIGFDQTGDNFFATSKSVWSSTPSVFKVNKDAGYQSFQTFPSNHYLYNVDPILVSTGHVWSYIRQSDGSQYIARTKTDGTESSTIFSATNATQTGNSVVAWMESEGFVYGLMDTGGAYNRGTFFKINIDGSGFTKLTDLPANRPPFPVILRLGSDGVFYAMAGASSNSVFISLTKAGVYNVIKSFNSSETGWVKDMLELPSGEWLVLNDTNGSSTTASPSIFIMSKQGVKMGVIYNFSLAQGISPVLFKKSSDGWLYVLTTYGGITGNGNVFKIRADGSSYKKIIDNDKGSAFVVNSMFFRKSAQTLSLSAIVNKKVNEGMFVPVYTSSSGVKPVLTSSNPSVAVIEQGFIKIIGAGTVKITAVIPENSNFYRSNVAEQEFTVTRDFQSVSFTNPGTKSFEDGSFALNATASSGLPVAFNVTKGYVTISGNTAKILQPGTVTIQALQPGDVMWNSAETVTVSFCVNPPIPIITVNESNTTLSTTALPNAWNASYQWYRNGTTLPNGNSLIQASESGSYTVSTTIEGCKSTSIPMPVVVTGIKDEINNFIAVYPNPVKNELNITSGDKTQPEELQLTNSIGHVFKRNPTLSDNTLVLEMQDLPSGVYILRMTYHGTVIYKRIVKE